MLSKHLEWAENNRDTPEGKAFLDSVALYTISQDPPAYEFLLAAADKVLKKMRQEELNNE